MFRVRPDGHRKVVAGRETSRLGDGGAATAAGLNAAAVAVMPRGGFLVLDLDLENGSRVRRVWPDGHISTVAGGGDINGTWHEGDPATDAILGDVQDIAVTPDGGFVFTDGDYVMRVTPAGRMYTVAGDGVTQPYYFGNGVPASTLNYSHPGVYTGSVSVLRDGGILTSFGTDVSLIVGRRGTRRLLTGIRALAGRALARGYQMRLALSEPARVTARLYRTPLTRPSITVRASRSAGDWTLSLIARRVLTPGVYAVDVEATAGGQRSRAVAWVYLGGRLSTDFVRYVQQFSEKSTEFNYALGAHIAEGPVYSEITGCRTFSATRIDCAWQNDVEGTWVSADYLTRHGQIETLTYSGTMRARFTTQRRRFERLNLAWGANVATGRPVRGLG